MSEREPVCFVCGGPISQCDCGGEGSESDVETDFETINYEAVWTGPPRGDNATCVLCGGIDPQHYEGCALEAALDRIASKIAKLSRELESSK